MLHEIRTRQPGTKLGVVFLLAWKSTVWEFERTFFFVFTLVPHVCSVRNRTVVVTKHLGLPGIRKKSQRSKTKQKTSQGIPGHSSTRIQFYACAPRPRAQQPRGDEKVVLSPSRTPADNNYNYGKASICALVHVYAVIPGRLIVCNFFIFGRTGGGALGKQRNCLSKKDEGIWKLWKTSCSLISFFSALHRMLFTYLMGVAWMLVENLFLFFLITFAQNFGSRSVGCWVLSRRNGRPWKT